MSATKVSKNSNSGGKDFDYEWESNGLITQPQSSRLTSILTHAEDLKSLAANYTAALPITLQSIITQSAVDLEAHSPSSTSTLEGKSNVFGKDSSTSETSLPTWGKVFNSDAKMSNRVTSPQGYKTCMKGVLSRRDLLCSDSSKDFRGRFFNRHYLFGEFRFSILLSHPGTDNGRKTFDGRGEISDLPLLKREGFCFYALFTYKNTLYNSNVFV